MPIPFKLKEYSRNFKSLLVVNYLLPVLSETKYSRMDQVKFVEGILKKIFLGPFLNTLSHLMDTVLMYISISIKINFAMH